MRGLSVTFSTPTQGDITWLDSYEGLSDTEIEELSIECTAALWSLEDALRIRHKDGRNFGGKKELDYCCQSLETSAKRIKEYGLGSDEKLRLSKDDRSLQVLTQGITALPAKGGQHWYDWAYTVLLWLVSNFVGPAHALLLRCSFGERRAKVLTAGQKVKLIRYLKQHEDILFCSALEEKAVELRLSHICYEVDYQPTAILKKRKYDNALENQNHDALGKQRLPMGGNPSSPTTAPLAGSTLTCSGTYLQPYMSTAPAVMLEKAPANFQSLDSDSKNLATLLTFLGEAEVLEYVLIRACQPRAFWGHNGEISKATAPNLMSPVTDGDRLIQAIQNLERIELITLKGGPLGRQISIDSGLQQHIKESSPDSNLWKVQATKFVLHTFPRGQDIDPRFDVPLGVLEMPQLRCVLSNFDKPDFLHNFSSGELAQVVECCLSSSRFSGRDWKFKVLATAERILQGKPQESQLWARICLRKRTLSRLSPHESSQWLNLTAVDPRSNAYLGEVVLCNAQEMIERNELGQAWLELESFKPFNHANPSTQEQGVMHLISFWRGKILRFKGHFVEARNVLEQLLGSQLQYVAILSRVIPHLAAVHCELGEPNRAIKLVSVELEDVELLKCLHQGRGRRLRLALAEAHLMTGLWIVTKTVSYTRVTQSALPEDAQHALNKAKCIYQELQEIYERITDQGGVVRMNCFSISAGLAMISQLEGQSEIALSYWTSASDAAGKCGWKPGFAEMIIAYSRSEVTLGLRKLAESRELAEMARKLFQQTGCQAYFTGLGTIWFDLVGDWIESYGGSRMSEQQ